MSRPSPRKSNTQQKVGVRPGVVQGVFQQVSLLGPGYLQFSQSGMKSKSKAWVSTDIAPFPVQYRLSQGELSLFSDFYTCGVRRFEVRARINGSNWIREVANPLSGTPHGEYVVPPTSRVLDHFACDEKVLVYAAARRDAPRAFDVFSSSL